MKRLCIISLALLALSFPALTQDAPKFTLAQCIEYAQKHSPEITKLDLTVKNQQLQTVIEEAAFDFTLAASDSHAAQEGTDNGSISASKQMKSGFELSSWVNASRVNGDGFVSSYVALQLSKTLLGGGSALATQYSLKASMIDELTSLNTLNRARRKLAQDIKLAYYNVINAQQSLLVQERALENSRHTLMLTKEREKPLDILTAEIRIPTNELSVNTAKRTIKNGIDALKVLMGMPLDQPMDITGEFDYREENFNLQEDIAFARDNLETFINNRLEREKINWQCQINDEKTLPVVKLNATHYQYGDGDGFNFDGDDEQVISLNFTYNIGSRAELARLGKVRNQLESNQQDYFILDQNMTTALTNYHRRLQESALAVKLQERICDFQKQKEELYRDKWENGEIDILELVRTQTDLEDSFVTLINKKISYMELVAYYLYTLGK